MHGSSRVSICSSRRALNSLNLSPRLAVPRPRRIIVAMAAESEIVAVTQRLLNSISAGDYDTYKVLLLLIITSCHAGGLRGCAPTARYRYCSDVRRICDGCACTPCRHCAPRT